MARSWMRRRMGTGVARVGAALGAALLLGAGLLAATPAVAAPAADDDPGTRVRVMTRNLYVGVDVGVALDLLPDFPAAAQYMWDALATTDWDTRVDVLAAEAAAARPDVIGLQEAARWWCRSGLFGDSRTVLDFTASYLEATRRAGAPYVVAERDGGRAANPGYAIPPLPTQTRVHDPQTFQPLFGSDEADCGFDVSDVLLVREDLADDVLAAGTGEYRARYAVVPVVFEIDRGYAWADLAIAGTTVRFVTTHLESRADDGQVPTSSDQARQLVDDLAATTVPLVVVGDLNADPGDPVPAGSQDPGDRPESGDMCPAQRQPLRPDRGDPRCNAYWTLRGAGLADAGPDPLDPANATWGATDSLAGPDPDRLRATLAKGDASGFTDRLDYVLVTNGAEPVRARVVGKRWPDGPQVWQCSAPEQVRTTEEASAILAARGLAEAITGRGVCLPTDHAGVVAVVDVSAGPAGAMSQPAPPSHTSLRIGLLGWLGILLGFVVVLVALLMWGVVRLMRRLRRSRAARRQAPATAPR